jgi:two-component system, LytTR family, response regulator
VLYLIIDDSKIIREGLRTMLNTKGIEQAQIHEAESVQSALQAIDLLSPDVVFLDVEMTDGTGFDVLKNLQSVDFQLIFITAHNHYAIHGFEFSAIDFLIKPIDEDLLGRALQRAKKNIDQQQVEQQLQILNESLSQLHAQEKKIALRDQENIYFIKIQDIVQCEANGAYTTFHIEGEKSITVSKTLKEYETILLPYLFFRAHHSHLINLNKIKQFNKLDHCLTMKDGSSVSVSVRKRDDLLKILDGI